MMRAAVKIAALAIALVAQCAFAIGPVHKLGKHPTRRGPPVSQPSQAEVTITDDDIVVVEMRAAEPALVRSSQSEFQVMSWNNADYDVATMLKPTIPAELLGATITAARLEITRKSGFFDVETTFSLKQILRTDVVAAQATWTNRATGSAWQTGGAQGGSDAGAALSTVVAAASVADETYTFASSAELVAYFQAMADGTEPAEWLLLHNSPTRGSFNVFFGPSCTSCTRPKFVVTKEVP